MISEQILKVLSKITPEEQAVKDGNGKVDFGLYNSTGRKVINSEKLLKKGQLITVRTHTRFVRFPTHSHDYVEAVYMCRGSTTHYINGKKAVLKTGELLILGQHASHSILPASEGDIAVNFIILPQFFNISLEVTGREENALSRLISDGSRKNTDSVGYLHFKVADVLPVQNLVENLLWNLINDAPNKRNINQTTMGLLFMQLLNCTDRLTVSVSEESLSTKVSDYVEGNYRYGSLSELARILHYDICWLSKEIKKEFGMSYTELVQEKRLNRSAYLLTATKMKTEEIRIAAGYKNSTYFCRLFKKRFGMTPKKYRDTAVKENLHIIG